MRFLVGTWNPAKMGSLRFIKQQWHPKTPGISPASPLRNDTSFYEALAVAGRFQRKFFNRFSLNRSRWVGQPDDLPITPNRGCSGSRYSWILFATLNVPICLIIDRRDGNQRLNEKWYLFASCRDIPCKYTNSERRWRDYYVLVYFITHLAVNIAPPIGWLGRWLSYLSFRWVSCSFLGV